jgi:hypothetical protein
MLDNYLELSQALGVILGLLLMGWMTFYSGRHLYSLIKQKKYSPRPLFKNFREKMWMTIGLGILFFSFYLLIVLFSSSLISPQIGLNLFFLFYSHPTEFIYLGLFIFACMSLSIYLVRMLIKYLYTTRNKG